MASEHILEFSDSTFQQEVVDSDQPVVVDFWAEWCQPCKMLAPAIEQLAAEFAGKAKVGKLDIDDNQQTGAKYQIRAIPTVLVFHNGEVQGQYVGIGSGIGARKQELADKLNELLG